MKKLFKKGIASLLATAIAVSSMIISASAAALGFGATTATVVEGADLTLALTNATGTVVGDFTATSSDKTVATVEIIDDSGLKAKITALKAGKTTITITDNKNDTEAEKTATREITVTEAPAATIPVVSAGDSETYRAYINGTKDTKSAEIALGSYTAKGRIVAVLTDSATTPEVTNGVVKSADAVKDIAKVSFKDGKVTVTAGKKKGNVYVHVFDIDSKAKKVKGKSASGTLVSIECAPKSINLFDTASPAADAKPIKSLAVACGSSTNKVYYKGVVSGEGNTVSTNVTYTADFDSKSKTAGFSVVKTKDEDSFTITAPTITKDSKNKVKTISGKLTITNVQSGKKATVTIIAQNGFTALTSTTLNNGYANLIDEKGDATKIDIVPTLDKAATPSTSKVSVVVADGEKTVENNKVKIAKSKLYSAKLQANADGSYRVRITYNAPKSDVISSAKDTQYVYLVVTDAAKNTQYFPIATLGGKTKTGEVLTPVRAAAA